MGNHYGHFDGADEKKLGHFCAAFVTALLFGESDLDDEDDDSSFLDKGMSFENFDTESKARIVKLCKEFEEAHMDDILEYGLPEAGADFYFTSAGHGVGFWENDYGTPEICERLNDAAKVYGSYHICLQNDRSIHFEYGGINWTQTKP